MMYDYRANGFALLKYGTCHSMAPIHNVVNRSKSTIQPNTEWPVCRTNRVNWPNINWFNGVKCVARQ